MSEEAQGPVPAPDSAPEDAPEQVRTGLPSIDDVIAAVEQLEERPLEEHVGVFETAHEQLRRALDAGGEAARPQQPVRPEHEHPA